MQPETDTSPPIRIALVEDDGLLRELLAVGLQRSGFNVFPAASGRELDDILAGESGIELAVLDVNLPGENGFMIAARLRAASAIGIVMLTARSELDDKVQGLDTGADIYLTKPVDMRELAATLRSLHRRLRSAAAPAADVWTLDTVQWRLVSPNGAALSLSGAESVLLSCLTRCPGETVTRDDIIAALGHRSEYYSQHRLDVLVSRLRAKTKAASGLSLPVRARRNIGYAFTGVISISAV
jgi:DNA-binding response OmpR family regulator